MKPKPWDVYQDHLQPPFPWKHYIREKKTKFCFFSDFLEGSRGCDKQLRTSLSLAGWRQGACLCCDIDLPNSLNLGPARCNCDRKCGEFGVILLV